jgi:hypothetical protein
MAKAAISKKTLHQQIGLKFKEETSKVLQLVRSFCMVLKLGTFRKEGRKYLESFEMWCWRMMEEISWTNRVKYEDVLHRVKKERNNVQTVKRRKAIWIGHVMRRTAF